ncbi:MAG: aminotransferase class III-fold pyridoxal phosphate-dependent enzyme, partial [Thermomicrobiales bacterium]|nr:aminotransferase class III-fold pyridoxal phosphate-dependent enzyme [Thermomicrobiales bacterium]
MTAETSQSTFEPARARGHSEIVWDHALGSEVWDTEGKKYIDFTSGVLVTNIGHAHPEVAAAVAAQAARLTNCYDFPQPLRAQLAERLVGLAGPDFEQAALFTTGAEAIDAALRTARAATDRFEFVAFMHGFHGRSFTAASVGGLQTTRSSAGPLLPGVLFAPYPYLYRDPLGEDSAQSVDIAIAYLEMMADTVSTGSIAAVIAEPYLGSGGGVVPPREFFQRIRAFCDERGALMILDEVQSGFGRAGSWFAYQQLGIVPDILVVAKGIANGLPLSAVLAREETFAAMPPGTLGSTYGGNPVSSAAALATLNVLERDALPERAAQVGGYMLDWLRERQDG